MSKNLFIILLLLCNTSKAQLFDSLRNTLDKKNIQYIYKLIKDDYKNSKTFEGKFNIVFEREIISNFKEILMTCDSTVKESPHKFFTYTNRIGLIIHYDTILYCSTNDKNISNLFKYKYSDSLLLNKLQTEYFKVYSKCLDINALFNDNIVFGNLCGLDEKKLEYRKKLEKLIKHKSIKELENWLKSPVTEIQFFAIDGFYQLRKLG